VIGAGIALFTIGGTALHWAMDVLDWVSRFDTWNAHSRLVIGKVSTIASHAPPWAWEACYAVSVALILVVAFFRTGKPAGTPKIVARESRTLMISPSECSMDPGMPEDVLTAAMLAFEYDPTLASGPMVKVRAELEFEQSGHVYQGGGKVVKVGQGYWRDTTRNEASFGPGVRHELIVAISHRGNVTSIQDERAERSDLRPTLQGLGVNLLESSHVVSIRLISLDETSRQRLAVDKFRYLLSIGDFKLELIALDVD
jgi:hypothetical protein